MKKINKKQKNIMRLCGAFLFAVALILSLNLIFNKNKVDSKFVGTWYMGYKYYKGETEDSKMFEFVQEIYLFNDGTFYSKGMKNNVEHEANSVSGTYKIDGDSVILTFEDAKKTKTLNYKDGKLCATSSCNRYYTKDKLEEYFSIYNLDKDSKE